MTRRDLCGSWWTQADGRCSATQAPQKACRYQTQADIATSVAALSAEHDSFREHDTTKAEIEQVMLAGLGLLALSLLAVFNPPSSHAGAWFVATTLLAATAFSVLSINFNALGGVWSGRVHERTRITAWREAAGFIGMLAAVLLPPSCSGITARARPSGSTPCSQWRCCCSLAQCSRAGSTRCLPPPLAAAPPPPPA